MRKSILGALLMGAMVLGSIPGHAGGSGTITYVALPGAHFSNSAAPVGLGGYSFTPPARPTTLDVDDLNGNGVRVSVCQENGSDPVAGDTAQVCGDGGDDARVIYCTNGSPKALGAAFKANNPVTVFVRTDGPALNCPTVGVGGTMVMTW